MSKVDTLAALLERLHTGEDQEHVKQEAKEFLATIEPKDLSFAEEKLIEAGLSMDDLQAFCDIHMDLVRQQLKDIKQSLPVGHVIHTLMSEHELILGFVDKLEKVNGAIQQMTRYDARLDEFPLLVHIAEHLMETELHHQREEEALFPEMETRGLTGPPQVMRAEHEQLRIHKEQLQKLANAAGTMEFNNFKDQLDIASAYIAEHLRDHIFKENNILYPTALQLIADQQIWDSMKLRCDEIGYCCFTPET